MGKRGRRSPSLRPAELDSRKNNRLRRRSRVEIAGQAPSHLVHRIRLRLLGAVDVGPELVIPDSAEILVCVRNADWHGWLLAQKEINRLDYRLLVACSANPEILAGVREENRRREMQALLVPTGGELVATA